MLVSCKKGKEPRGSHILVSDRVDGGYVPLTGRPVTPPHLECLDATLYFEEGKPYIIYSHEWLQEGGGALYYAPLTSDLKDMEDIPRLILTGKHCGFAKKLTHKPTGAKGYVAEGPFLHKYDNNKLALFWSTYGENGYCVALNISNSGITGKFNNQTVVFDRDGGHCMVFSTKEGNLKIIFHQPNSSPYERAKIFDLSQLCH